MPLVLHTYLITIRKTGKLIDTQSSGGSRFGQNLCLCILYILQYPIIRMNDPLSPLTAPPPRYLLESDSSDEEGQGFYPSSSSKAPRDLPTISVNLEFDDTNQAGQLVDETFIGIGQAGRYIIRKAGLSRTNPQLELKVKDGAKTRSIGSGWKIPISSSSSSIWIIAVEEEQDHRAAWEIARRIKDQIQAKSWYGS